MTVTDLWLLRHARPDASSEGRCYGSLDVGLAPDALAEIRRLAPHFPEFHAVYSSPRRRCLDTAALFSREPIAMEALAEMNFGQFEGRSYDEIARTHPTLYASWMASPTEVEFPGGESFAAMRERVLAAGAELRARHRGETILVVAHGGVNRILLAEALGIAMRDIFRMEQRYGAVNWIRYFEEYAVVELVNGCLGFGG